MRVLVTGGTGFVGRHVVAHLMADGFRVRILSRNPKKDALEPEGAEFVAGDAAENIPAEYLDDVSAVVHLVGIISERGGNTFQRAHPLATANAVRAATGSSVRRFIHLTALGTRPHAASQYHRSKWDAEEIVRTSGLDWTILRPSLIFGPGCGFVTEFASMMRGPRMLLQMGVVPCFGDGETLFQPIGVGDVAHCVSAALRGAGVGQTAALAGRDRVALKDMLLSIARNLGRRPTWIKASPELYPLIIPWALATRTKPLIVAMPPPIPRSLGWLMGHLPNPPFTLDQAIMLEEDNVADYTPAARLFQFEPRPFSEILAESL